MKKLILALLMLCGVAFAQTESTSTVFPKPEGRGALKVYTCSDPAAGVEWSCTVPAGKIWRVVSLNVSLVSSATVATRAQSVLLDDGTSVFYQQTASASQAASLTYNYVFSEAPFAGNSTANVYPVAAPSGYFLGPGYRVRSSTTAIQAGDNYGAPIVFVEEWNK